MDKFDFFYPMGGVPNFRRPGGGRTQRIALKFGMLAIGLGRTPHQLMSLYVQRKTCSFKHPNGTGVPANNNVTCMLKKEPLHFGRLARAP